MRKLKTALLVSAALLATSAQAWEYNWLLGVSAGGAWHDSDDNVNVTVFDSVCGATNVFALNNNNDDDNFIWGFLAGFQGRCNGWLIGGEINVDWRGNGDDDRNFSFDSPVLGDVVVGSFSHDRDVVVGLTARLGYAVAPFFMPYIRLGVDHGDRDFDYVATTTTLAPAITVAGSNGDND